MPSIFQFILLKMQNKPVFETLDDAISRKEDVNVRRFVNNQTSRLV